MHDGRSDSCNIQMNQTSDEGDKILKTHIRKRAMTSKLSKQVAEQALLMVKNPNNSSNCD